MLPAANTNFHGGKVFPLGCDEFGPLTEDTSFWTEITVFAPLTSRSAFLCYSSVRLISVAKPANITHSY